MPDDDTGTPMMPDAIETAQAYLIRFGYLPSPALEGFGFSQRKALAPPAAHRLFDDSTALALRRFQQIADIPPTGELDDATIEAMIRPRCGFPDVGQFVLQGNRWPSRTITYGFQEMTPDLPAQTVRQTIEAALALWSGAADLQFAPSGLAADILIRFVAGDHGDGFAFDGPGNVLAHGFFPSPGVALAGDCHFDEAEQWTIAGGGIDLLTVAAHEFGHCLGLAHSTIPTALMYPYYSGPHRQLEPDDVDGIRALYGAPAAPTPAPTPDDSWARLKRNVETDKLYAMRYLKNADGSQEHGPNGGDNATFIGQHGDDTGNHIELF